MRSLSHGSRMLLPLLAGKRPVQLFGLSRLRTRKLSPSWRCGTSNRPQMDNLSISSPTDACTSRWQTYSTGNYTCATAVLTLERRAQGYVLSYMILAVVFVAMSYTGADAQTLTLLLLLSLNAHSPSVCLHFNLAPAVGCFMNPAATPGRVALAVITLLTVSGLQVEHLPSITLYIKPSRYSLLQSIPYLIGLSKESTATVCTQHVAD